MAALHTVIQVLEDPDDTGGAGIAPVAGDRHKVDGRGVGQHPQQVADEDHRAAQHAHQRQILLGVVFADLRAQLLHPFLDLRRVQEDLLNGRVLKSHSHSMVAGGFEVTS